MLTHQRDCDPDRSRTWRPDNELWDDLRGSFVMPRTDCLDYPYYFSEQAEDYDPDFQPRW